MTESQYSSLSFTQGFILGQLSVCALLFIFIKFFIFGDPPSAPSRGRRPRSYSSAPFAHNPIALSTSFSRPESSHDAGARKRSVLRPSLPLTTPAILSKTYYNVSNHQPESLDWFNVLVAQTIAQMRVDACQDDIIVKSLSDAMNGSRRPDFLDEIKITEINLGEEFPIFSNCRVIPVSDATEDGRPKSSGVGASERARLQARMDVDLSDALTIGIETKLVLNYPRPRTAVMPVALAVSVVRFSGTLSISFIPSTASATGSNSSTTQPTPDDAKPSSHAPRTHLAFSFSPSYRLELSTHSLLGSRSRLQDVPKIAQIVESRLHDWFDERCVAPRFQQVMLPNIWPRARNTRGAPEPDSTPQPKHERSASRRAESIPLAAAAAAAEESAVDDGSYEGSTHEAAFAREVSRRIKDSATTSVDTSPIAHQRVRPRMGAHSRKASGLPAAQISEYQMPGALPDS